MSKLQQAPSGLGLTDFSFEQLGGRRLAKTLFVTAWLGCLGAALAIIMGGLYLMMGVGGIWFLAGAAMVFIIAPIMFFVALMIFRMLLEVAVVLIQIEENTRSAE